MPHDPHIRRVFAERYGPHIHQACTQSYPATAAADTGADATNLLSRFDTARHEGACATEAAENMARARAERATEYVTANLRTPT